MLVSREVSRGQTLSRRALSIDDKRPCEKGLVQMQLTPCAKGSGHARLFRCHKTALIIGTSISVGRVICSIPDQMDLLLKQPYINVVVAI